MAAVQILPASRSELERFLEGRTLGSKFHALFDTDVDEALATKYDPQIMLFVQR